MTLEGVPPLLLGMWRACPTVRGAERTNKLVVGLGEPALGSAHHLWACQLLPV